MEQNREYFSAMIFYNFRRGLSQQECINQLNLTFHDEAPSKTTVCRWFSEFSRGRSSLCDEFREGHPKSAIVPENIDAVCEMIKQDRHVIYCEIEGCGLLTTVEEPKPLTDSWDELAENSRGKEQRNSGDYIWNENCLRNIRADKRMTNTNKSAIKKLKEKTPVEGDLLLKEANYHLLKNVGEDAELLDANDTSGRQPYTASASQQPRITLVFLYLSKIFQR
ncbi:uncharacterized protein LOC143195023 isoform X2 [Rhynchophorus ferrugineus]|uniref:uncharacterized protein LOC143195023 isoform X2 n=1 Tax=Rhynchophorus ferrugineus TaxID=354439 RepID=UPI003FCCACA4